MCPHPANNCRYVHGNPHLHVWADGPLCKEIKVSAKEKQQWEQERLRKNQEKEKEKREKREKREKQEKQKEWKQYHEQYREHYEHEYYVEQARPPQFRPESKEIVRDNRKQTSDQEDDKMERLIESHKKQISHLALQIDGIQEQIALCQQKILNQEKVRWEAEEVMVAANTRSQKIIALQTELRKEQANLDADRRQYDELDERYRKFSANLTSDLQGLMRTRDAVEDLQKVEIEKLAEKEEEQEQKRIALKLNAVQEAVQAAVEASNVPNWKQTVAEFVQTQAPFLGHEQSRKEEKEHKEHKEDNQCAVCFGERTHALECRHFNFCESCAKQLRNCPICRTACDPNKIMRIYT